MITARTITADDVDLAAVLDGVFAMHSLNYRPWWQCSEDPYPTRDELDRMMVQTTPPLTLVIAESDGEIVGYDFHSPEGVLLAGFVRHNDEHKGFTSEWDEWALSIQRAMIEKIKKNTGGTIYHVTFWNQSIWYALEVLFDIPRAPEPYPQNTDPAPTGWATYTGPPPPES